MHDSSCSCDLCWWDNAPVVEAIAPPPDWEYFLDPPEWLVLF